MKRKTHLECASRLAHSKAFSLVEMLVVLAITAVMLGIILVPMIQSFNFTRAAEGLAEEQDRGRFLIDQISRDIASGTAVADNQGNNGETVISMPAFPYAADSYQDVALYNSRIDIYKPALSGNKVGGAFVNENNGHIDPTLGTYNGQPIVPATQGATIVRYWIGLRRPLESDNFHQGQYNEPFDGVLMPVNSNEDNLYVLYKAEFQPYLTTGSGAPTYNSNLFKQDPKNPGQPYLDDPYFFIQDNNDPNLTANGGPTGQATRIQNWLKISTVVTEEHRFDMIMPVINGSVPNQTVKYVPLIQFRPSPVSQEPPASEVSMQLGNETTVQSKAFTGSDTNIYVNPELGLASDILRTVMGAWNSAVVSESQYPPLTTSPPYTPSIPLGTTDYETFDTRSSAANFPTITPTQSEQNVLMLQGVANATSIPAGEALFDLVAYANPSGPVYPTGRGSGIANMYPFSWAVHQAEVEDGDDGATDWLTLPANIRNEFIPFDYDPHAGQIETGFNIGEVGNWNDTTPNVDNDPQVTTSGTGSAYSPSSDPGVTSTTNFYDPGFDSVNEFYNACWFYVANPVNNLDASTLRPMLQRFVDLRLEPEADGWASPMDPDPTDDAPLAYVQNNVTTSPTLVQTKTPWASSWVGFNNVTIIPGSEQVIGPDQTSSLTNPPNVIYTRVTTDPGANQYTINYTNQSEPSNYQNIDPSLPTQPAGQTWDPTTSQWSGAYNPHDFITAVIQPRYKAGYVAFDSDPNLPMPVGPIHISYRFQFNRPADQFSVNYDSREVINVLLTIRSYPQTTNMPNPQTITLQASAPVKNYIR